MIKIINTLQYGGGLTAAAQYIHNIWGNESNYNFYLDAISHSSVTDTSLPRFYLMLDDDRIVGCYALLINDLISRQDLFPWFACLYIEKDYRGRRLSELLFDHARQEAFRCGFQSLYLATDHTDFYERFGWTRIEDGYEPGGKQFRIYTCQI